jgi:hypothetical protein
MKNRIVLFIITLLLATTGFTQSTTKVQTDSLRVFQVGNNPAELILLNGTRVKDGAFLRNRWNGRTEFAYALDSVWADATSIYFRRGPNTVSFVVGNFFQTPTLQQVLTAGSTLSLNNTINVGTKNLTISNFYHPFNKLNSGYWISVQAFNRPNLYFCIG